MLHVVHLHNLVIFFIIRPEFQLVILAADVLEFQQVSVLLDFALFFIRFQRIYQCVDILVQLVRGISLQHVARGQISRVGVRYFALVQVETWKLRICSYFHISGLKHELTTLVIRFLLFAGAILRNRG